MPEKRRKSGGIKRRWKHTLVQKVATVGTTNCGNWTFLFDFRVFILDLQVSCNPSKHDWHLLGAQACE